jgi:PAS domain-containing protein
VGLRFDELQRWLESERHNESDRISLLWLNNDGSATLLASAPRVNAELGVDVTAEWVARAAQSPTGIVDVVSQLDGVSRRVAFERLSGPADQPVLVFGASTQTALAVWRERLPYWVGFSLLLSVGIAQACWRLNRSLRELSLSEQRFQLMLDSGNVWDWDLTTGLMRYAPSFLAQLGYTCPKCRWPRKPVNSCCPKTAHRWRKRFGIICATTNRTTSTSVCKIRRGGCIGSRAPARRFAILRAVPPTWQTPPSRSPSGRR